MEISGIAYCADNKSFQSFPISSGFVNKSPNMGVHQSNNMPFVELTGHQETVVHQSFGMSNLSAFGIVGKFHSFTENNKPFVRSNSFLTHKDPCTSQFPAVSISQLVGGFVGSKSQIGSSTKESCQIWDIVLNKLAEVCGSHNRPENYYNKFIAQEVLGTFCKNTIRSHIVVNSKNTTQDVPDCAPLFTKDVSKQSYAEVAKIFAVAQQKKQQCASQSTSAMPRKRNPPRTYYKSVTKCQFTRPIENNWRNHCRSSEKEYRKRPEWNRSRKSNGCSEKELKTDKITVQQSTTQTQRVNSERNWRRMTSYTVQTMPQVSPCQSPVASSRTSCSDQDAPSSPMRKRFMSECSTDSDDSFVEFKSEVDCDSDTAQVHSSISDSELSEDQCSDDDDVFENDSDDAETVTELSEVNKKWSEENSAYPGSKKNPVKVQFADSFSLKAVYPMVAWNFAYRAARKGPWEEMARDRERFRMRIVNMESLLAPVLKPDHRTRVWKERMTAVLIDT